MIKILSLNKDGKVLERFWDNINCNFYNDKKEKVDVSVEIPKEEKERLKKESTSVMRNSGCGCENEVDLKDSTAYYERTRYNKTTLGKSKNIASIRIQMGMSCNYTCQYCKQFTHKKYDAHTGIKDAKKFIANFDNICTTNRNEPINIQLWGGEPFVYWEVLQVLGEFFRNEFPRGRITVLSNGSLIGKEQIEWLLKYKIVLAVSHDGPGQLDYRSGDCLEEGSDTLKWLRHYAKEADEPLYFNAVITRGRYDLTGIVKHIENKIGGNVRIGFEGIVLVEDEGQFNETTMFAEADYLEMRKAICSQIIAGNLNKVGMFRSRINQLMSAIIENRYNISLDSQQKCSMDSPYNVSFDLKGNILACHSTPKTIGHVDKYEEATLERISFIHWSERKECLACPVLYSCRGGCLAQDATAFYHSCNNEFHYQMIIFEVVFGLLFGESLLSIEGVERPTKKDFQTREFLKTKR